MEEIERLKAQTSQLEAQLKETEREKKILEKKLCQNSGLASQNAMKLPSDKKRFLTQFQDAEKRLKSLLECRWSSVRYRLDEIEFDREDNGFTCTIGDVCLV